jgi:hypothetical protein
MRQNAAKHENTFNLKDGMTVQPRIFVPVIL